MGIKSCLVRAGSEHVDELVDVLDLFVKESVALCDVFEGFPLRSPSKNDLNPPVDDEADIWAAEALKDGEIRRGRWLEVDDSPQNRETDPG